MKAYLYGACAAFAVMTSPVAAANAEDTALNAVYAGLARARAVGDAKGMADRFGPGGLLIDARPQAAIAGSELEARLKPMAERLNAEGVKIDTAYRIERRSVMNDIAIDAGYMRQTVARPGAAPMVRHARFLVTMRREADGSWRIIGDASMPADEAAFNGVARTAGLHHDA